MAKTKDRLYDTADTMKPYVDRALHDDDLHDNLKEAFSAARDVYAELLGGRNLTGTAVRVRSYSRYGLDGLDVARLSVFVTVTATLGLLTAGGLAFLTMPGRVSFMDVTISLAPLGILLLLPIVGYVAWSAFGRSDFHGRGRWRIRRPAFWSALAQISIASIDWVLAGTVLYFLLPPSLVVSYSGFLGVYLVAQTAAVLSHVPGGVGVFEAIVISFLTVPGEGRIASPFLAASLAGSLFIYRVIYYVVPLGAAIAFSGIADLIRSRRRTTSTEAVAFGDLPPGLTARDAI